MKELSITNLAKIIEATIVGSQDEGLSTQYAKRSGVPIFGAVRAISTDSRSVQPGDCFFAIAGENFDGHNYIADVFAKGAVCAVVSKDVSIVNRHSTLDNSLLLKVDDTVKALGVLAAWYRKDCNFKVVAITGSAGKTTTRQIVHHVLSKKFKTHQPTKNFNNFIGLPLSILAAPPDTQILILELATNHPGEIEYLSRIAAPDIALVTNVHPAHLAGFGSIENIAKEKLSISQGLSPHGVLIINADCPPLIDFARKANLSFKTFHCPEPACGELVEPVEGSASKLDGGFSVASLSSRFNINGITVEIPLPGWGNLENALAAWSICSNLGVAARDFADAVKTITPVSMRCEILNIGSLTVISDCYNANPASMQNALDILSHVSGRSPQREAKRSPDVRELVSWSPVSGRNPRRGRSETAGGEHRLVFICGDMAELGIDAEKYHTGLGRLIAGYNVSLLLTAGPLAALAADAAKQARPDLQTCKFSDSAKLADNLHQFIKDSDIILVKGSRINKLETVVEKLKVLRNVK